MARFTKGMIPWNKGLKGFNAGPRDQQWKDNISAGLKKTYDQRGRKSHIHKLMRKSREYTEWRSMVFERDDYRCQCCGKRKDLHPHHIKSMAKYPEQAYDVGNGVTLCQSCHGVKHGMDFTKAGRHLICKQCGSKFRSKSGHLKQKYCSRACHYEDMRGKASPLKGRKMPHRRRARIGVCLECNAEFRAVNDFKNRKQKYCSQACYLKHRWQFTGKKAERVRAKRAG
jgi:hypothetical protein